MQKPNYTFVYLLTSLAALAGLLFVLPPNASQILTIILVSALPVSFFGYLGYLIFRSLELRGSLTRRVTWAFLVAPLLPAVLFAAYVKNVMWFFLVLEFCYLTVLILTLPVYIWISKRTTVKLWHCLVAGLIIGSWPCALFGIEKETLMGIGIGLLSSVVFWMVGIKPLPKSPKSP